MAGDQITQKNSWPWPTGMVGFFDAAILALFQSQSDKYQLSTDYFEGSIKIRSDYYERLSEAERESTYINVSFGFRRRTNCELAVAIWLPDLSNVRSEPERLKWLAFHLQEDAFPREPDSRFELWIRRYIHGDWGVDNGVLFQVSAEVASINAITDVVVGERVARTP